ncbi:MAG: hypothetical protein V4696_11235 [Pseudomonadota bacterium]
MILFVLAFVYSWLAHREWTIAAWSTLAGGFFIGVGLGRIVATRLAFHSFDGLLASDALQPASRRRYQIIWVGLGLAIMTTLMLVTRPSLLIVAFPAYLAGVAITGLSGGPRLRSNTFNRSWRIFAIRVWLQQSGAGAAAAVVLLVSLLPARSLGTDAQLAIVGMETSLLVLALTIVDHGTVHFMTIAGHGSSSILRHHAKSTASFVVIAIPGCWLALGPFAAAVAAVASGVMLLLMTLRAFAYRLHSKRFGDHLVSILVLLLVMVAYSAPVALPVAAIAIVWNLHRRGRAKTWLLA